MIASKIKIKIRIMIDTIKKSYRIGSINVPNFLIYNIRINSNMMFAKPIADWIGKIKDTQNLRIPNKQ